MYERESGIQRQQVAGLYNAETRKVEVEVVSSVPLRPSLLPHTSSGGDEYP
jgi:hypothetical protein